MAHCKKKKKKKKKPEISTNRESNSANFTTGDRASRRGVQGPAEGPLVGIEGAKPPEAAGF